MTEREQSGQPPETTGCYCPRCGKQIPGGATLCSSCAANYGTQEETAMGEEDNVEHTMQVCLILGVLVSIGDILRLLSMDIRESLFPLFQAGFKVFVWTMIFYFIGYVWKKLHK